MSDYITCKKCLTQFAWADGHDCRMDDAESEEAIIEIVSNNEDCTEDGIK